MSPASSYHQMLPTLDYFVTYISQKICNSSKTDCVAAAQALLSANYVDIDFDTISHAVILRAYWNEASNDRGWTEVTSLQKGVGSLEIGVLNNETPDEPEELKMGGFLTVVGTDLEPSRKLSRLLWRTD